MFVVLVGQRKKSQKYFDLSTFNYNLYDSNPCSSLGVMNFQKWELFSGSPGIIRLFRPATEQFDLFLVGSQKPESDRHGRASLYRLLCAGVGRSNEQPSFSFVFEDFFTVILKKNLQSCTKKMQI